MPVMRHLNVGGTTYDTVGEASVTRVQTTGTKIATITIDGTATDLYAPEGGGSVTPSSTTPAMDGTAAVGTSTDYARADHVHPTDTSRAAASHSHAISDVTSLQSALDGKAAASHSHAISDVTNLQTTLDGKAASTHSHAVGDLPTGTGSNQVALGNHTHSGYASSSHTHGSISNAGAITSDTTVASGDKLVFSDQSDSSKLKRSTIQFGVDSDKFLCNNGTWGSMTRLVDADSTYDHCALVQASLDENDGPVVRIAVEDWVTPAFQELYMTADALKYNSKALATMSTATASLATTGWANNSKTDNVTGVTASNNVIVAPAPADMAVWSAAGIVCTAQGAGTLTFTCSSTPTAAVTANVLILG